jgi:predicted DNA-binding transcriptional regulator
MKGITYIASANPSPEAIERMKKRATRRDERIEQMQKDYESGRFKGIIDSL